MGRTAETRELECVMLTWAWGARPGVRARGAGLPGRSTMVGFAVRVLVAGTLVGLGLESEVSE